MQIDLSTLLSRVESGSGADELLSEYCRHEGAFWSRVDRSNADGCWIWTGTLDGNMGYGRFTFGRGGRAPAHRVAFALRHGRIPRLLVCHTCDNPPCVNPAHLWEGTAADNNRDRANKGRTVRPIRDESRVRYARGERHGSAKLTAPDVVAIRQDPRPLSRVSKTYGISTSTAGRIKRRELWRDVP